MYLLEDYSHIWQEDKDNYILLQINFNLKANYIYALFRKC